MAHLVIWVWSIQPTDSSLTPSPAQSRDIPVSARVNTTPWSELKLHPTYLVAPPSFSQMHFYRLITHGSRHMSGIQPISAHLRAFTTLAMPLCKSLTLAHTKPKGEDFASWHHSLNLQNAAQQVHHVTIHSTPDDLASRLDYKVWQRWEEKDGQYPAFETAINRIAELPHLEALELRFSDRCQGIADKHPFSGDFEEAESRINTLKAVFGALEKRAANPKNSAIRSLTIENLQNLPIPNFTKSNAFSNVMKNVKEIHLSIATEYNEHGPDRDVYKDERQTFVRSEHKFRDEY